MYTATNMKTTIEIAQPLLNRAKRVAAAESTTLRALVEDGLRKVLNEKETRRQPFRLQQVTFKGKGLQPELNEANWEQIRALAYEGHGG